MDEEKYMTKIWDCIHIFGKKLNQDKDSTLAFQCFFECLTEILHLQTYNNLISTFMEQNPIDISNPFYWTFSLHSWCNFNTKSQLFTFETLSSKYNVVTMSDWSSAVWFLLHFLSCNIAKEEFQTFRSLLMCVRFLIPCDKCKGHMEKYIKENKMKNDENMFEWIYKYHKDVDKFSDSKTNALNISLDNLYSQMKISMGGVKIVYDFDD
jgi:hypothetical protein